MTEGGPGRSEQPHEPDVTSVAEAPVAPARLAESDVYLHVPEVKVEEINLEVQDLRARVSLRAEVLDLLKLNVGADVELGRVNLTIKGVEARAVLKVRLHNVAHILDRVLRTIDDNPQILEHLTRGIGTVVEEVGTGAGHAVRDVGAGAGTAVRDVGAGAGTAVRDVGAVTDQVAGMPGAAATGGLGTAPGHEGGEPRDQRRGAEEGRGERERRGGEREDPDDLREDHPDDDHEDHPYDDRDDPGDPEPGQDLDHPDVEIGASARARELRHHERPDVEVHTAAEPSGRSASISDRTNLPERVEANVTYRDVRIDFRVVGTLTGEE
ncbi:MAG TPA: hypothetical protein VFV66_36710 [Nonomuraea sp.]|nr:hypothetical protein [Nonomuraea sp.]